MEKKKNNFWRQIPKSPINFQMQLFPMNDAKVLVKEEEQTETFKDPNEKINNCFLRLNFIDIFEDKLEEKRQEQKHSR